MRTLLTLLAAFLLCAASAAADETPSDPYEFILAKLAASEGHFNDALARLDRIIDRNPNDAILLYERALVLLDASRVDRAESELRKVLASNPDFYEAHRILGRLLLDRAGNDRARVDEALSHLQTAVKLNGDDLSSGMAVVQILVGSGRAAEAEPILAALLERAPDQRALNYTYAQVLTKLGRGDESRPYLERVVLLDPTFGPAVLQLVDIYQKENEWAKAADVLLPLIAEDPLNLELQRQQAFFYLRAGMPEKAHAAFKALLAADPTDKRSQFYLAEAFSDMNQFAEADAIYRKLLEESPNDADILASFGLSQLAQKNLEEAARVFRQLLGLKDVPENLQVLSKTQLANIELQRGNYKAAVTAATPVFIFHDKPNVQAISTALEALKRQKLERDAIAMLQPLVDKFGGDPFVNARYIEMLLRAGEMEKARAAAATQVKFGSRNTIGAAEAYIQAGSAPAAITLLQGALKTKSDDLDLTFELGSAFERAGDTPSAEKTFLRILDEHPDHAATLNYLGYMWADSGIHLDRAADMLKRAVTQEPANGAYIDSLGWVYYRQGKLDLAEKYLTDATRLLPRDAAVHEHLADVVAKRGQYTRALDLYRAALGLDLESKDEAKIRSKIAELEKQQTSQR